MIKLILFFLITVFFSQKIMACRCSGLRGFAQEAMENSSIVFLGIPLSDSSQKLTPESREVGLKTEFKILKSFKLSGGEDEASTINIYSTRNTGANCGISFKKEAGVVLIFANLFNGRYFINSCSVAPIGHNKESAQILLELI